MNALTVQHLLAPTSEFSPYLGVINFQGITLGIEHAAGTRNPWSKRTTRASYGEIPGTLNVDGDPVDFLLCAGWDSAKVFIIQQRVPDDQQHTMQGAEVGGVQQYDEDKVVLGTYSAAEAEDAYRDYYQGAGRQIGGCVEWTIEEFRAWIEDRGNLGLPVALDKSMTQAPPGGGWQSIPGGTHGGFRRRSKSGGWEYHYGRSSGHMQDVKEAVAEGGQAALAKLREVLVPPKKVLAQVKHAAAHTWKEFPQAAKAIKALATGKGEDLTREDAFAVVSAGITVAFTVNALLTSGASAGGYTLGKKLAMHIAAASVHHHLVTSYVGFSAHGLMDHAMGAAAALFKSEDGDDGKDAEVSGSDDAKAKDSKEGDKSLDAAKDEFILGIIKAFAHQLSQHAEAPADDSDDSDDSDEEVSKGLLKPPGAGWTSIPGGKRGGYRRGAPGNYDYWYPRKPQPKRLGVPRRKGKEITLSREALDRLLKHGTYSIVSAGRNPESPQEAALSPDDAVFTERHQKLKRTIASAGFNYTEVVGHYDGIESSIIVFHEEPREKPTAGLSLVVHHRTGSKSEFAWVRDLGARFNQDSVIHVKKGTNELVYTTGEHSGEHHKGKGFQYLPLADDYFTRVTHKGAAATKFSLEFDWSAYHTAEEALLKARRSRNRPPGSGWEPTRYGKKQGGMRRRKSGGGYEYWYPDQDEAHHAADWEKIPGRRGTRGLKRGAFVAVAGKRGTFRYTPEHDKGVAGRTWVTSVETGKHVLVDRESIMPLRGFDPKERAAARRKERAAARRKAKPKVAPKKGKKRTASKKQTPKKASAHTERPKKEVRADLRSAKAGKKAVRAKVYAKSRAKEGSIRHKLENGGYMLAAYHRPGQRKPSYGVHVPPAEQNAFVSEFEWLTRQVATQVARSHAVSKASPAYEDVKQGARLGLVMALPSYAGGFDFTTHARTWMRMYAKRVAEKESLAGQGANLSHRKAAVLDGFLAAQARSRTLTGKSEPTNAEIAREWSLTKQQASASKDLGFYTGTKGKLVDQAHEQVPMGPWRIKGPDGKARGRERKGKVDWIDHLKSITAGDRVKGSDWLDQHPRHALPGYAALSLPAGTALQLQDDVTRVLDEMSPKDAKVLRVKWYIGEGDKRPDDLRKQIRSDLAVANKLGYARGKGDASKRRAVKPVIDKALASFKRLASAQQSPVAKLVDSWHDGPAPIEEAAGLIARFGDNPERIEVYELARRAGREADVGKVLEAEQAGTATELDSYRVRQIARHQRDTEAIEAHNERVQRIVEPTDASDVNTGTPADATWLYTDEILHSYAQAIANQGLPKGKQAASIRAKGKVWSDKRLAQFMGRRRKRAWETSDG